MLHGPRIGIALAGVLCYAHSAAGQSAMKLQQPSYELRAGEAIPIAVTPETRDFLAHAHSRHVEIVAGGTGNLFAGPSRAGDQILLAAPLRMKPGEYTIKLSAAGASG